MFIMEMADGARICLTNDSWLSDSRPALAGVLNTFYKPTDAEPADKLADRIARRFRWQLLPAQSNENGLNSSAPGNGFITGAETPALGFKIPLR